MVSPQISQILKGPKWNIMNNFKLINLTTQMKGKFPERHKLQKHPQEKLNNLNRLQSIKVTFVVKNLPTKKMPGLVGFTGEIYQTFKKEI